MSSSILEHQTRLQQELWMRAKLQVLTSLKPVSAMIPTTASFPKSRTSRINSDVVKPETGNSKPATLATPPALPPSANPLKASRTHQELHKELLLAHRNRGLVVCSRPELQLVLEKQRRKQTDRERGEQDRTPLEQVMLRRQQRNPEQESQPEGAVKVKEEQPQLLEFVRVRQNLRKIHSALNKPTNSEALPMDN
ncbi:uncharacterized protein si:ch211-218o21.4 isoform X1 [Conger conger]|uniref:uncharacterized protein si:ch211-218o21.4 isoform X1 n=2 Tax=Conger conger TaxID=82655 RepID=UPI002A5ABB02|nr:uncharacterized protein si:ch211-218o21.4 isoform X1 [Conger conger]